MDDSEIKLMAVQTLVFVSIWVALDRYISRHGPISYASTLIKYNSRIYAVASFGLLLLILSPSHDQLARQLYSASKFYEYIDIFLVRGSGGSVNLHFGFHHLTTPWMAFARVLYQSRGWKWFAALNAFHHALMYAHFGGARHLRTTLFCTGEIQLVVGILVDLIVIWETLEDRDLPIWPNVLSASLLAAYLLLNTRDIVRALDEEIPKKKAS